MKRLTLAASAATLALAMLVAPTAAADFPEQGNPHSCAVLTKPAERCDRADPRSCPGDGRPPRGAARRRLLLTLRHPSPLADLTGPRIS
jgi:hypothetical protein